MSRIKVLMLSLSDVVKGQGVSSAFHEQVNLVLNSDLLEIKINEKFKDAQIIHHHTIDPRSYFKMNNKRYIHIAYVHTLAEKLEGSIKLNKYVYKIFQKYTHRFYRKADYLVIVNPDTKAMLLSYGIAEDKIHYIPNYVDNEKFYKFENESDIKAAKNKYGISEERFTVLSVGQVLLGKGVRDFMLSAKNNPEIDYVWAGGFSFGPLTDGYSELKEYVENPLANVKFLGIVDRNEINEVYNACDVLFMPSLNEMFPMTILEAINTSKPLVIRNLDLYEDILFDKYRKCAGIDDFDDEIRKLSTDKDYFRQSQANSDYLSNYYRKDYVLKLWEQLYTRVVNDKL